MVTALDHDRFITVDKKHAVQRDSSGAVVRTHEIANISAIAANGDGKQIAFALPNGSIEVFDANNGNRTALLTGHTSAALAMTFSADGKRLVSMSSTAASGSGISIGHASSFAMSASTAPRGSCRYPPTASASQPRARQRSSYRRSTIHPQSWSSSFPRRSAQPASLQTVLES
jgi:hypothetical protein